MELKATIKSSDISGCEILPDTMLLIPQRSRLMRQITNASYWIGDPIADDKIRQNNRANNVKYGDKGYIPESHEYIQFIRDFGNNPEYMYDIRGPYEPYGNPTWDER